jgi:hypothetical protein
LSPWRRIPSLSRRRRERNIHENAYIAWKSYQDMDVDYWSIGWVLLSQAPLFFGCFGSWTRRDGFGILVAPDVVILLEAS